MARTSSITNAFYNGIIPVIEPTEKEIDNVLDILEINKNNVTCCYCGDVATEWDHLRPLIVGKKPTGYISEIANLVPCCGKCNQSKGNKNWEEWINSSAKLSPRIRNVKDINKKIEKKK
jgi:endonuclease I